MTEPNRKYKIAVEKLTVPARDSLVLNTELFSIKRRIQNGQELTDVNEDLPLSAQYTTFTPIGVRSMSDMVFQMNDFFSTFLKRIVTKNIPHDGAIHQYAVPDMYDQQNVDWFTGVVNAEVILGSMQAIFRSDGQIGFKFTPEALTLFVLKFTTTGKRVFNVPYSYLALDDTSSFSNDYVTVNLPLYDTASFDLPDPMITEPVLYFSTHSLFSHMQYRHELAVLTSVSLNNKVECDEDVSFYRHELASYRFPDTNAQIKYKDILYRRLVEERQTLYTFEESLMTHNKYILTGTDLQNFHIYLVSRTYTYQDGKYVQTESPYLLGDDEFYSITLTIKPL